MTTAASSGPFDSSPLQDSSSEAPHEFLGKELASMLESNCSPSKEISDFNPATVPENELAR